jgi:hypothetical protein
MDSGTEVLPNPIPYTNTFSIVSYNYSFNNLILFTSINVNLLLMDASGNIQKIVNYLVQGEEYTNWNSDDSYIINLLNSKIPGFLSS